MAQMRGAFCLSFFAAIAIGSASEQLPASSVEPKPQVAISGATRDAKKEEIAKKLDELTKRAALLSEEVVKQPTDETLALLKKLLDEITSLRAELKRFSGQSVSTTPPAPLRPFLLSNGSTTLRIPGDALGKMNIGGFYQYQFTNTDQIGGPNDAFRARRVRLNLNHIATTDTAARVSVEFGSGLNQTTAQIRDAFIQKRLGGLDKLGPTFTIGQQNTPLGYEISVPSFIRTWTERALYNQALFSGERGRGLLYHNGSEKGQLYFGPWNALTVNDIEQVNLASGPGDEVGVVYGFQAKSNGWEYGISGLNTQRPEFTAGSTTFARSNRNFGYLHAQYASPKSPWHLKSEYMVGMDRIPGLPGFTTSRPLSGYHVQLDHKVNANWLLMARHEGFDRNLDATGDTFQLWGIGAVYDIDSTLRLTFQHQWNTDGLRSTLNQTRFGLTTFMAQYRF